MSKREFYTMSAADLKRAAYNLAIGEWYYKASHGERLRTASEFMRSYPEPDMYAREWWEERYLPMLKRRRLV